MKTEYLILWIDDDISTIDVDRVDIEEFLAEFGIKAVFDIAQQSRESNIHERISGSLHNPDLDIILVDFHMAGLEGPTLIEQIRETDHVYLPVIFYSTSGVDALMEAAHDAQIEGVYFANRNNLVEKVKQVARSLLNKEHTVKRTRGLLMEGFSEIDATFGKTSKLIWNKLNEEQKEKSLEYFKEKIVESFAKAKERSDHMPTTVGQLQTIIDDKLMTTEYDSIFRWKFLKEMMRILGQEAEQLAIFGEINNKTTGEIPLIKLRNDYAHKTREELDSNHGTEKCVYIRREVTKQIENLQEIEKSHTI